jgi:ATP-binding cassette subfamily F protein 3
MIDINNLSIQFTGENLFENVNLRIGKHDKIALVGSNGKGKSTFLKLLNGFEQPETGSISKQKGIRIGYLPQDLLAFKGKTLFDEVKSSLLELKTLVDKENQILDELRSENIDEETRSELVEELGDLHHAKEQLDFYSSESRIEKVLMGLGFLEKDFLRNTEEFSGGWQMRIQMAKILLAQNDLILLDEPTNHLDIDTLTWLEDFLQKYNGALIIVSHDRHFINHVTNKTLEIYFGQINFYPGTYEQYLNFKDERDAQLRAQALNREKKIKETEKFIERFRYKASKARQVQSRIKQLEKIDSVDLIEDEKTIEIRFPEPPRSGIVPVELKNIFKSYGQLSVLKDVSVQIERGDKIAIVGPNGAGKTTLAKIIGQKISYDSGELIFGHNTLVSYYEQEVADGLNPENDLIDTLEEINDEISTGQLRKILGSFLFSGDDVFKKIKVLSGGEKSRVALARLLLTKSNFIILDEPTNHLDFNSKKVLQKALIEFSGTLLIVSHDIDFIRPLATKTVEIRQGNLKLFNGGIDYYLQKRIEQTEVVSSATNEDKLNRKDQKRLEAEIRQKKYNQTKDIRKDLEKCEKEIEKLESLKSQLEKSLSDPEVFSNPNVAKETNLEYEKTKQMLNIEYDRWAELSSSIEEIEKNFSL